MPDNPLPNLGGLTPEQIQEHLDRHPDGLNGAAAPDCEIVCVIDRSGSMGSIVDDAIGGFNAFLEGQKKEAGSTVLSMTLFDHEHLHPYAGVALGAVPAFTRDTYVPRGSTALFDAIGSTLTATATRHASAGERRPRSVVVVILTDGHENASVHFSGEAIASMIDQRRAEGWQFVFLSADQAAFDTARRMNIAMDDVAFLRATPEGVQEASRSMGRRVFDKRAMLAEQRGENLYAARLAHHAERDQIEEERRRQRPAPPADESTPATP